MKLKKIPFTTVGFMADDGEWNGIVSTRSTTQYWVKDNITGFYKSDNYKKFYI